jgi:hypothetical protein
MFPAVFTVQDGYGRYHATTTKAVGGLLTSDAATPQQKIRALLGLVDYGNQIRGAKTYFSPDGATNQGYFFPVNAAYFYCGDWALMPETMRGHNEVGQTGTLTQEHIDLITQPHARGSDTPYVTWMQTVTGVNVIAPGALIDITCAKMSDLEMGLSGAKHTFRNLRCSTTDGAKRGLVVDQDAGRRTFRIAAIGAEPFPDFRVGDIVFWRRADDPAPGSYDWSVQRFLSRNYSSSWRTPYRSGLNAWSATAFVMRALHMMRPEYHAMGGYAEAADRDDYPSADNDWGGHTDSYWSWNGVRSLWEQNAVRTHLEDVKTYPQGDPLPGAPPQGSALLVTETTSMAPDARTLLLLRIPR